MNAWYWIGHRMSRLVAKFVCSYRVQNRDRLKNLPSGGLLIVSNHVSFLDPPFIGAAFDESLYYFARKSLFDHPITEFLLPRVNAIPVNQEKPELSSLKLVIQLLKAGEKVLIFPEGERSYDGVLKSEGESGVGLILSKTQVPVLPLRLFGAEKALPRGGSRLTRHPVTLVVGEMRYAAEFDSDSQGNHKEQYQRIADEIMAAIADLELEDSRGE